MSENISEVVRFQVFTGREPDVEERWVDIDEAGCLYGSLYLPARLGKLAVNKDGNTRPILPEEITQIVEISDDYQQSII